MFYFLRRASRANLTRKELVEERAAAVEGTPRAHLLHDCISVHV